MIYARELLCFFVFMVSACPYAYEGARATYMNLWAAGIQLPF